MMRDFIGDPFMFHEHCPHHHHHDGPDPMDATLVANASAYARLHTMLVQHINNDTMHITDDERRKWNDKADASSLDELRSKVLAISNSIPTKVSQLQNDLGYITNAELNAKLPSMDNYVTWQNLSMYGGFVKPEDLSDYVKRSELGNISSDVDLTGYATRAWVLEKLNDLNPVGNEYATLDWVIRYVASYSGQPANLNDYALKQWVEDNFAAKGSGGQGGAMSLNDLSDVEITNPKSNQVLKYVGGTWVNDTDSTGSGGQGDISLPSQKIYFLNVEEGVTPQTPTVEDFLSAGWREVNNNPGEGYCTWAIWVTYQDGLPISIQGPVKLTGPAGTNGEDGTEIEWAYNKYPEELNTASRSEINTVLTEDSNSAAYLEDDHYPTGWTDNPDGVDNEYKYEYAIYRISAKDENGKRTWEGTSWHGPVLWSAYGKQGTDGDGVQYIFKISLDGAFVNQDDPSNWDTTTTEFLAKDSEYYKNGWSDDPQEMTVPGQKVYVSTRKWRNGAWTAYSDPVIWAYYAKDGDAGIGITIDTDNDMIGIPVNSNNVNTTAVNQTSHILMYQTSSSNPLTIEDAEITSVVSNNGTPYSIAENKLYIDNNNDLRLNVSAGDINFGDVTSIIVTIKASTNINNQRKERFTSVQIIPVKIGINGVDGQDGNDATNYDLGVDTKIIKRNKNNSVSPDKVKAWLIVSKGTEQPVTYSSNLPQGFSIVYGIGDDLVNRPVSTEGIPTDDVTSRIVIALKYNNTTIDQEIVWVVGDGADGQDGEQGPKGDKGDTGEQGPAGHDGTNGINGTNGADAVTYQVIPLSSSLKKVESPEGSGNYKLSGSVSFQFVRIEGTTREIFVPAFTTDVPTTYSGVYCRTGVMHNAPSLVAGDGGATAWGLLYVDQNTKTFTFGADLDDSDNVYSRLGSDFVTIQLRGTKDTAFNYPIASVVIPISIPGENGKDGKDGVDGSVQSLDANVLRISTWEDPAPSKNNDYYYIPMSFGTAIENPIVKINGAYMCIIVDINGKCVQYKNGEPSFVSISDSIKNQIVDYISGSGYIRSADESKTIRVLNDATIRKLNLYNNGSVAENGIYYTDVVNYGSLYYRCTEYGNLREPCDENENTNDGWSVFGMNGDQAFDTLLAKSAYILDLTSKNVVITNTAGSVVAGMTSGSALPEEAGGTTNTGDIRIWAGPIPSSGNLKATPFNVDSNGSVVMYDATINGTVSADAITTHLYETHTATIGGEEHVINPGEYKGLTGIEKITVATGAGTTQSMYKIYVNGLLVGYSTTVDADELFVKGMTRLENTNNILTLSYKFSDTDDFVSTTSGHNVNGIKAIKLEFTNNYDSEIIVVVQSFDLDFDTNATKYYRIPSGLTVSYISSIDTAMGITNFRNSVRPSIQKAYIVTDGSSNARPYNPYYDE